MEKSIGKAKTKFLKQVQMNFRNNLLLGPRAPQLKFTVGPEDEPAPRITWNPFPNVRGPFPSFARPLDLIYIEKLEFLIFEKSVKSKPCSVISHQPC